MHMPRHSTVIAYIALFVALGGTSYAAVKLDANSVGSREIKPRSIRVADLHRSARPTSKARIAQVVTDTMTSTDVLQALSTAVEGDPGPKGDKGDAVAGPQGAAGTDGSRGASGSTGPRGAALGFAHVTANGTLDSAYSANVEVLKPDGFNVYCVKTGDGSTTRNIVATADQSSTLNGRALVRIPPPDSPCAGWAFQVTITEATTAEPRAFFVTLN